MKRRYNSLSDFLKQKFGCRVFKVSLNAGFTCPNRDGTKGTGGCIYCNPLSLEPSQISSGLNIKEQLSIGIEYIKKRHNAEQFIAYFQINSNTYAPLDVLEDMYNQAISHPLVVGLAVSTRPDGIDKNIISLLSELSREKYLWLELGLQSANDKTLKLINRCHTVNDFINAVNLARAKDIPVVSHVILGLPEETHEDMLNTAMFLAEMNIWGLKLHHLHIHKDTKLEDMYKNGEIKLMGLDEYANTAVDFLERIYPETIIHRLCGDTSRELLIAPNWSVNKFPIIDRIHKIMEERDTYQGSLLIKDRIF
ncbi:MAG: TIGR01212 family radical SAM protein [Deltaproteobacteria bacterium]|nr:TIGR01212 family radical SAM protein [Deltaproteobacteria bacterium]